MFIPLYCINCRKKIQLDSNPQRKHIHELGSGKAKFTIPICSDICVNDFYGGRNHENLDKINVQISKHIPDKKKRELLLQEARENHSIIKIDEVDLNTHDFSKIEMGRLGWGHLHSFGDGYPDEPNQEEQNDMQIHLETFFRLYPCLVCRTHFLESVMPKLPPIDVSTRRSLREWICGAHNAVNSALGKPLYPFIDVPPTIDSSMCQTMEPN